MAQLSSGDSAPTMSQRGLPSGTGEGGVKEEREGGGREKKEGREERERRERGRT